MKNLSNNIKEFCSRVYQKNNCNKGLSEWVTIAITVLIVLVIGSTIFLPRTKKTSEKQFDNVDERLEDVFNYK